MLDWKQSKQEELLKNKEARGSTYQVKGCSEKVEGLVLLLESSEEAGDVPRALEYGKYHLFLKMGGNGGTEL